MYKTFNVISLLLLLAVSSVIAADGAVELARYEKEFSKAHVEPAVMGGQAGLAVIFEGSDDLHFYANAKTVPAPGYELKISAESQDISFEKAIFPKWEMFDDPAAGKLEVYVGDFEVFIPFGQASEAGKTNITVTISGLACTSQLCLAPFTHNLETEIDLSQKANWKILKLDAQETSQISTAISDGRSGDGPVEGASPSVLPFGAGVYMILAVLAGVSINIMPCVLPVIPLILMRLIKNAKESSEKRMVSGGAFCFGIIGFFAMFAIVSAVINLTTGAMIDINSLFRYPTAVIILFLAILFFALVMMDVIILALPSSVSNKQNSGSGVVGSFGMGFFAGVLSTPCSGALIGFVLVWAQTQPLLVSSAAIILMGVGMAIPYAIIIMIPKLLDKVPKPGIWMEMFKKTCGFLLLFIAAKLTLAALPKDRLLSVLSFGIIFSFCVWVWGNWVTFSTPAAKKWMIRLFAAAIVIVCGGWLLPSTEMPEDESIAWQKYDAEVISDAISQGRPVVVKFTADWCTNCKVVDKKVYRDAEVIDIVKENWVLAIKADTTLESYRATQDLKKVYGEAGNVPVTIVLQPGEEPVKIRGIFDKDKLIDLLNTDYQ